MVLIAVIFLAAIAIFLLTLTFRLLKKPIVERHVVLSGAPMRIPAGGVALPGTRIDLEKGQNVVRYLRPARKDPARKIGGRKEMALALSGDEGGGEDE